MFLVEEFNIYLFTSFFIAPRVGMSFTRSGFILENSSGTNIRDVYEFSEGNIGEGSYGSVRRGVHKKGGQVRAIKIISKNMIKLLPKFRQEIAIMKSLEHPNIVRLYETYEDAAMIYLVMELCEGGELFDQIIAQGFFTERAAAVAVKQMLGAILYLHNHGVCHRDLKPENFLLATKDINSPLKLIDFGLSGRFETGKPMTTRSGTPYYVAPEVLAGSYTELCDEWSVGVLGYVLLAGYPPFNGSSDKDILQRVRLGKVVFPPAEWNGVSTAAKHFITRLLELNPEKRMTAQEALEHTWLKNIPVSEDSKVDSSVQERILQSMKAFRGISKLKKVALTAIAHQLQDSEISDLKKVFTTVDVNGDGTLTVAEIRAALERASITLPPDFDSMVAEIDSDGSGFIDYMEFIAATMDRKVYNKRELCWRAFSVFDRDGDGRISLAEFSQVLQDDSLQRSIGTDKLREMIQEFDLNGDGEIDFDEFMAMMQR
jgi:calcium-dependent protein kinase